MIYVTHDQVEAMTLADKIVVLGAPVVAQVGKPLELYHYPANRFVAGFIGSPKMNFLPVKVTAAEPRRNYGIELPNRQPDLAAGGRRGRPSGNLSWAFALNICC